MLEYDDINYIGFIKFNAKNSIYNLIDMNKNENEKKKKFVNFPLAQNMGCYRKFKKKGAK